MKKLVKFLLICSLIGILFVAGIIIADKQTLGTQIIRLHVVGNSNSDEDQSAKLTVKDAVVAHLDQQLEGVADCKEAKERIENCIPQIQQVATQTLRNLGFDDAVSVSICKENFGRRDYDTFALPSGVYQSLRISIGEAAGRNWWCVVFPGLCNPTTSASFQEVAVDSGMQEALAVSLSKDSEISYRFFLLDCIGKVENFFNFS